MIYTWAVFAHLVGVFGFLLAHGASIAIAVRLPRQRDPRAVCVLLDLSETTRGLMYGSLALMALGGVTAGFLGGWWSHGWIWASIFVLLAMLVGIVGVGVPYFRRLRVAAEASMASGKPSPEFAALLKTPQPWIVTAIGVGGLVIILWLMVLTPF